MTCIMTGNSQWWLEKKNYGHPSETKLWLICGYHGLTMVTMFFWGGGEGYICSKANVHFHKGLASVMLFTIGAILYILYYLCVSICSTVVL